MRSKQNLAKDAALVGFAQIVAGLSSFVLLPLISKNLGSVGYGLWVQITVTVSLLAPLGVLGLHYSLVRFLSTEIDMHRLREGFYSILIVAIGISSSISMLVIVSSRNLANSVFGDPSASSLIAIASFLIILTVLEQIALFFFRVTQQTRVFAILSIFKTGTHFGFIAIALIAGQGVLGIIIATLLASLIEIIISLTLIIHKIGFEFPRFNYIRTYLSYGLPLALNPLIKWISDSGDRYLVGIFLGIASVGIYSAAYTLANILILLIGIFQYILFPTLSRLYDEGRLCEVRSYLSHAIRLFLMVAIPVVFGLSVLAEPLLRVVTSNEFVSGSIVMPFVAVSSLLAGIFQISVHIIYIFNKTRITLFILLAGATANIVVNIVLIPSIGILGAAIATLISYVTMVLLTWKITAKYLSFDICWWFIGKSIASSGVMALLVLLLNPEGLFEITFAIGLGAMAYFALLTLIKGITKSDMNLVRSIFLR